MKCGSVSSIRVHYPFRVLCRGFPSGNTEVHASSAPRDPLVCLVAGCRSSTGYPPHTFVGHRRGIFIICETCSDIWRTRAADPIGPPWSVPPSSVSALCHPSVPGCQQYCSLPSNHKKIVNTHHQCFPASSSKFGSSSSWGRQRRTSARNISVPLLLMPYCQGGTTPLGVPSPLVLAGLWQRNDGAAPPRHARLCCRRFAVHVISSSPSTRHHLSSTR